MKIKSTVLTCTFAVLLLLLTFQFVSASAEPSQAKPLPMAVPPPSSSAESGLAAPLQQVGALTATVQTASGASTLFKTNNGVSPTQEVEVPHFILYQDGNLTREVSRTSIVTANSVLSFSSLNSVIQKQEAIR